MAQDLNDPTRTVSAPAKDVRRNPGQHPAPQAKRPDEVPKPPAQPGAQPVQRQTFEDQTATAGGFTAQHRQASPTTKGG